MAANQGKCFYIYTSFCALFHRCLAPTGPLEKSHFNYCQRGDGRPLLITALAR